MPKHQRQPNRRLEEELASGNRGDDQRSITPSDQEAFIDLITGRKLPAKINKIYTPEKWMTPHGYELKGRHSMLGSEARRVRSCWIQGILCGFHFARGLSIATIPASMQPAMLTWRRLDIFYATQNHVRNMSGPMLPKPK